MWPASTQAQSPNYRPLTVYFAQGGEANEKPSRLTAKRSYRLVVAIGSRSPAIEVTPALAQVEVPVSIVVRCGFCAPRQREQSTSLRLKADSGTRIEFDVTPQKTGAGRLIVAVERDDQIATTLALPVDIAPAGARPRDRELVAALKGGISPARETASIAAEVPARFLASATATPEADALRPRALTLPEFNALKAELVIEVDANNARISMKGPVVGKTFGAKTEVVHGDALSHADLQNLLIDSYNRLYTMMRERTFPLRYADTSSGPLGYVQLEEVTKQRILYEFARLGNKIYLTLFAHSRRLPKVLQTLRDIPGTPKVYIKTAGAFLPWALIYEAPHPPGTPDQVDMGRFWGSRYAVVGVPMREEAEPETRVFDGNPYRFLVGYYSGQESPFPTYRDDQRNYLESNRPRFEVTEALNEDEFLSKLKEAAESVGVVYLFAHGKAGPKMIQARLAEANRIVEFVRPDPAEASIRLSPFSSSRTGLTPDEIRSLNIDDRHLARPLVFLNVCEGAATAEISQSNFVSAFFSVGAGAVIATDAEMLQALAAHFARSLFSELQGTTTQTSLGDIMLKLRRKYLSINPLVYTYTLWGDGVVLAGR